MLDPNRDLVTLLTLLQLGIGAAIPSPEASQLPDQLAELHQRTLEERMQDASKLQYSLRTQNSTQQSSE